MPYPRVCAHYCLLLYQPKFTSQVSTWWQKVVASSEWASWAFWSAKAFSRPALMSFCNRLNSSAHLVFLICFARHFFYFFYYKVYRFFNDFVVFVPSMSVQECNGSSQHGETVATVYERHCCIFANAFHTPRFFCFADEGTEICAVS